MAAVDIESVIKKGVELALNEPIMNGKSVMQWAEIGIHSQEQKIFVDSDGKMTPLPIQKHGHWIVHGGKIRKNVDNRILKCAVCNNYLSMSGVNGGRGNANYCPNCGAIMDEEVKQDGRIE